MRYLKILMIILTIILVIPQYNFSMGDQDAFDVKLKMRMYEGFRKLVEDRKTKISTYFLDPYYEEEKNYLEHLEEEKGKLKKVFNLTDIHLETEADWYWPAKMPKRLKLRFHLKRQQFDILISKEKENRFDITVTELQESNPRLPHLLETEIKLVENNTIIIGFEDSKERVFFLSFYRQKDSPARKRKRMKMSVEAEPSYPDEALAQNIQGNVVLEAQITPKGETTAIKVWQGHPFLVSSAKVAASQMKFSPNGQKKISIILIFSYYIEGENSIEKSIYLKKVFEKIKATETWKKLDSYRQKSSDRTWLMKAILIKGKK
jgi:TonB family protein